MRCGMGKNNNYAAYCVAPRATIAPVCIHPSIHSSIHPSIHASNVSNVSNVCHVSSVSTAAGVGSGTRRFLSTPTWLTGAGGELHPYQLEGLNWLYHKWTSRQNVILADEVRRLS
jgi:hypothetical protein